MSTTCWQVSCFCDQLTSSFARFGRCSHNINNMILWNIAVDSLQPACIPASPFAHRLHPILPSHPAIPSSHPVLPSHFIPSDPSPSIPSHCGCSSIIPASINSSMLHFGCDVFLTCYCLQFRNGERQKEAGNTAECGSVGARERGREGGRGAGLRAREEKEAELRKYRTCLLSRAKNSNL